MAQCRCSQLTSKKQSEDPYAQAAKELKQLYLQIRFTKWIHLD